MRSILGKIILAPVVMAAAALATNTAMAETATVQVPFSFTAAGKTCPAGPYLVRRDGNGNIVVLQSKEAPRIFAWLASPGAPGPTDTKVTLRFSEDGATHTLETVQYGSVITRNLDKYGKHSEHAHARMVGGQ